MAFLSSVDGTIARQETLRSSVIEIAKMSNIYDFGRIGYRKDGTFAHKSRLDPENQVRISKNSVVPNGLDNEEFKNPC